MPLLGRMIGEPGVRERMYHNHFSAIAKTFRDALRKALPRLSEAEVSWRHQFVVGSMTHVLCWGPNLSTFTEGLCHLENRDAVVVEAVRFLAAGLRAAPAFTPHEERIP